MCWAADGAGDEKTWIEKDLKAKVYYFYLIFELKFIVWFLFKERLLGQQVILYIQSVVV